MKKVIERIVKSPGSPDTNDLWLDENLNLKVYDNEEWKSVAGGSGSGSDSGSSSVMIVEGTLDDNFGKFIPNNGSPSVSEAIDLLKNGGIVYLKTKYFMLLAGYMSEDGIIEDKVLEALYVHSRTGSDYSWFVPVIIYGSISGGTGEPNRYFFNEAVGQMPAAAAKSMFDNGLPFSLSYEISGETIIDNIKSSVQDALLTERDVIWPLSVNQEPIG